MYKAKSISFFFFFSSLLYAFLVLGSTVMTREFVSYFSYVSYYSIHTLCKHLQPIQDHIVSVFKGYHMTPPPHTESRKPTRALQNKCYLIIVKPWKMLPSL